MGSLNLRGGLLLCCTSTSLCTLCTSPVLHLNIQFSLICRYDLKKYAHRLVYVFLMGQSMQGLELLPLHDLFILNICLCTPHIGSLHPWGILPSIAVCFLQMYLDFCVNWALMKGFFSLNPFINQIRYSLTFLVPVKGSWGL